MPKKPKEDLSKSDIIRHVRRELEDVGMFDDNLGNGKRIADAVLELAYKFAKQQHSASTAPLTLQLFYRLCSWELLGEPTSEPTEWKKIEPEEGKPDFWQNQRAPMYVSKDAGKHWHRLDTDEEGTSKEPGGNRIRVTRYKDGKEQTDAKETNGKGTESKT